MTVQVGINGFGRIGRQVLKAIRDYHGDTLEVVAFNDIGDLKTMAHLLKYDSNYGRFDGTVEVRDDALLIDGKTVKAFKETDPGKIPWGDLGVDIVVESTGLFTIKKDGVNKKGKTVQGAENHITRGGAKKVIISAPAEGEDLTIVMGVNDDKYDPANHHVVSNASCTTNCLAPAAKVVNDKFHIVRGLMTTIRVHQRPEDPGPAPQRPAPGARGRHEHHPDDHRRGQGRRVGHPRAEGQVRRLRAARADLDRLGRGLHRAGRSADHHRGTPPGLPRSGSRPHEGHPGRGR